MERMLHPLEQAAIDVQRATDSRGLNIYLCAKPFDIEYVRGRMLEIAGWLGKLDAGVSMFLQPNGEEAAARNLKLLAALLEQNLIERRVNPDACKPPTY